MDQALYPNFKCFVGSKVMHWNFCTRMDIRKGREPGNEANLSMLSTLWCLNADLNEQLQWLRNSKRMCKGLNLEFDTILSCERSTCQNALRTWEKHAVGSCNDYWLKRNSNCALKRLRESQHPREKGLFWQKSVDRYRRLHSSYTDRPPEPSAW